MDRLTTWWRGKRLASRQQRRQVGHDHAVSIWWLQGVTMEIGLLWLALLTATAYGQGSQQLTFSQVGCGTLSSLPRVAAAAHGQRLRLIPSLCVGESYDDNIFQRQSNKTDDFITSISPGIHVQYLSTEPTPDTQLNFGYRANVELFADNSSQNQVGHRASLAFASQLAPSLTLRARDLLIATEEPFGRDERLDDPTGLRPRSQQQRARTLRNQANAQVDARLGGRTALGVLFDSLIDDVETPAELDEFRYTVGTELGYIVNVARDSRVLAAYQVAFHTFRDNGVVVPTNNDTAFQVHTITAGWRHELTPTLAVNAALGYTFTSSDDPANDGHEAVTVNIGATKTFSVGQASLNYRRYLTSGEGDGGAVLADTVRGSILIDLTGKLAARLDSNVSWFEFQSTPGSNRDRVFWSLRPSLIYQILPFWEVSAAYIYEITDFTNNLPTASTSDRTEHRLLVGTQFALHEWLLLGLSYRYTSRLLENDVTVGRLEEFARHQVTLTLTASPSFRF